ncbi:hypothetical protein RA276_28460, partial [Pseudomonas syringae pv. tagetis]|uniref:hypothetical protein n=1 Tax=Pseudomonas syringae group genomosp. 7 TaxID=251699 RepID=UPI0037700C9F
CVGVLVFVWCVAGVVVWEVVVALGVVGQFGGVLLWLLVVCGVFCWCLCLVRSCWVWCFGCLGGLCVCGGLGRVAVPAPVVAVVGVGVIGMRGRGCQPAPEDSVG